MDWSGYRFGFSSLKLSEGINWPRVMKTSLTSSNIHLTQDKKIKPLGRATACDQEKPFIATPDPTQEAIKGLGAPDESPT